MSKKTASKSSSKKAAANTATKAPEAKTAKKVKQPKTPEEMIKALRERYPDHNIIDDSLQFNEAKSKYSVEIVCQHKGCNNKRRVFTSDLFQVKLCEDHTKEARRQKRKAKRNAMKDALKAATPKA